MRPGLSRETRVGPRGARKDSALESESFFQKEILTKKGKESRIPVSGAGPFKKRDTREVLNSQG